MLLEALFSSLNSINLSSVTRQIPYITQQSWLHTIMCSAKKSAPTLYVHPGLQVSNSSAAIQYRLSLTSFPSPLRAMLHLLEPRADTGNCSSRWPHSDQPLPSHGTSCAAAVTKNQRPPPAQSNNHQSMLAAKRRKPLSSTLSSTGG